jgi:predicted glycosyltransferase
MEDDKMLNIIVKSQDGTRVVQPSDIVVTTLCRAKDGDQSTSHAIFSGLTELAVYDTKEQADWVVHNILLCSLNKRRGIAQLANTEIGKEEPVAALAQLLIAQIANTQPEIIMMPSVEQVATWMAEDHG